jgi:hypothetical protein
MQSVPRTEINAFLSIVITRFPYQKKFPITIATASRTISKMNLTRNNLTFNESAVGLYQDSWDRIDFRLASALSLGDKSTSAPCAPTAASAVRYRLETRLLVAIVRSGFN